MLIVVAAPKFIHLLRFAPRFLPVQRLFSTARMTVSTISDFKREHLILSFTHASTRPYAEVATYLLSTGAQDVEDLSISLTDQLPESNPPANGSTAANSLNDKNASVALTIRKQGAPRSVVKGKSSILRYLSSAKSSIDLAHASCAKITTEIEECMDLVRRAVRNNDVKNLLTKVEQQGKSKKPSVCSSADRITLADLMVWDAFVQPSVKDSSPENDFVKHIQATYPQLLKARQAVDRCFDFEPPLDPYRRLLTEMVAEMTGLDLDFCSQCIEPSKDATKGQFSVPVPKLRLPGPIPQVAQELLAKFKPNEHIVGACVGGAHLIFQINMTALRNNVMPRILSQNALFGTSTVGKGKVAVLDYSSPNIAKPFHAGHLRSTIIGNFVKRILEANGWKAVGINYLGDWGKQYGLLAIGFEKFGSEEELSKDPIKHLFHVYVQINKEGDADPTIHDKAREYFKKMEDGDQQALALWKKFRDLSIVKYKDIYKRLNIEFDVYSGESQFSSDLDQVLQQLKDAGLLIEDDGAQIVDLNEFNMTPALIAKKDGSTLYITRDIAAAMSRKKEYDFDAMYYVVGTQQELHFRQLFKILSMMGNGWAEQCTHIGFGMIKGMSTRKGTVVFLEQMLDDTASSMHDVMRKNEEKYKQLEDPERVADVVGLSAIVVQDMSARRHKDYEFKWDRMLSFEGDTGPYLQYAHTRLCSVERNSGINFDQIELIPSALHLDKLTEKAATDLLMLLCEYPDVIRKLPREMEPVALVNYLFRLCRAISVAWDKLWVISADEETKVARLALYKCCRVVLGNALRMIGLEPLERM